MRVKTAVFLLTGVALCAAVAVAQTPPSSWPQWGGPNRNFQVEATGLADSWPAEGPRRIWSRPLGEGYSSIVVEAGVVYTQYRDVARFWQFGKVDQEAVVALDAQTGKTLWEHRYEAPILDSMDVTYGPGPHATPLVVGERLYAAGATGRLFALEKKTGRVIWSHDLVDELGVRPGRGYANSPLDYQGSLILPIGGTGPGLVAFDLKDGRLLWKNQSFDRAPASPVLIQVDGEEQLVLFHAEGIAGVDPKNGALLWGHPHRTDYGLNISTPVWGEDNLLFLSSAYSGGSRVLHLSRAEGKTRVRHLWFSNRLRIHFGTAIRLGDTVYGSSGDFGPAFLTAVDIKTGKTLWQERGFARAQMVHANGRILLLDEKGVLALASVSPQGLQVRSRVELLSDNAWTPPTLVGTRLYLRDRKTIVALELGRP
jgi:outer membrane protein assembly factor BamB